MSTYTFAALSTLGRARPADAASSLKLPANVKRGLGMLATLSLTAGPAAAQATDAVSAPIDIGRIALAFGVLTAIALLKVWSYADKRGKLMDRLPGYLTSRAVHRARHASTRAQQPQRSSTATRATRRRMLSRPVANGRQAASASCRCPACRATCNICLTD